ncbi:PLD nuclease N-terminal domain-containing protein [Lutibacter flavus]|uniref:Phospholipase_D-nuclease N-terminal n=1 Tax=Lutibacter flavus TaxID=691689 RepID=A0A238VUK2_9FLAO|nr:PLD nuclease N-terminal domain-containing protein [Lutibacter flavus]SNR38010.1 Phospholipase_D-nuclease N-terminal [Lutibacter flavus]
MTYLGMVGIWQTIILLLAFSGIILTILALIDILKSEFRGNNKIVWTLVVLFLNLFGALLYFTIGRNQKI